MADGSRTDPPSRHAHLAGDLLLLAETAQIFALSEAQAHEMAQALAMGDAVAAEALSRLGLQAAPVIAPATPGPVRALALTVSQGCNMACGYCYAAGGAFGGPSTMMPIAVARQAIDRLIGDAPPGGAVKIAFMGGEPMMARDVIREAVAHARARAAARAVDLGFAMTTNATLLRPDDAEFLARHRFVLTVSLDGPADVNDRLRPMRGGAGSFARALRGLAPVLAYADRIALSARVTVTPDNLDILGTVRALSQAGLRQVGVSPMITAPSGRGALSGADFERLLAAMTEAGNDWLEATIAGRPHAFANLATALGEVHRGQPRSTACGAARDYLAVDASGKLSACHRFVNDPLGAMGSLEAGIDEDTRAAFLSARSVEGQKPCARCWARRLCGGGCHHEVLHAGRPACDFVRGWLDFTLRAYARLMAARPDWFDGR